MVEARILFPEYDIYLIELDVVAGQPWLRTSRLGIPCCIIKDTNPRGF